MVDETKVVNAEEGVKDVNDYYDQISEELKNDVSETERRRSVCNDCPSKTQYFGIDMCEECGCFLKIKTVVNSTTCPLDKW